MSTPTHDQLRSEEISRILCRKRQECLDIAEALLLTCSAPNDPKKLSIAAFSNDTASLTKLHDQICEVLASSSSLSSPSLLSQIVFLRRRLADDDDDGEKDLDDAGKLIIPNHRTINLAEQLHAEADLYRVLWITSLILMHVMPRATFRRSADGNSHSNNSYRLKRNVTRCKFLIGMLDEMLGKLCKSNGYTKRLEGSVWQRELQHWMSNRPNYVVEFIGGDTDHGEEGEINLLTISREQLEMEEKELLIMASAPTPLERHGPQPITAPSATPKHTHKQLEARLLLRDSSLIIPVLLDERKGILRHIGDGGADVPQTTVNVGYGWAITSQSTISPYLSGGHSRRLQISNVVCIRTGKVLGEVVLDVGGTGTFQLWWEQISRIVVQVLDGARAKQEDLIKSWSTDEVVTAQKLVQQSIPFLHEEVAALG